MAAPDIPMSVCFLLGLQIAVAGEAWAGQVFELVPLAHRRPEEVAPLLRPLLSPGDVLTYGNNQLAVKTSPEQMAQLKALLQSLDQKPHRLLISVRQGDSRSLEALNAGLAVGGRALAGHLYQTEQDDSRDALQQVQTLDGAPARIQAGSSRMVPARDAYGRRVLVEQNLSSGFAVLARLVGDGEALLEIQPWSDRPDAFNPRRVQNRQAHTTLRAKLGQWVMLGGMGEEQSSEQTQILGHSYSTGEETSRLLLKVDDLE